MKEQAYQEYNKYILSLTPLDVLVICLVFISAISFLLYVAYKNNNNNLQVNITTDDGAYIYPLDKDRELVYQGPLGTTSVHIQNGMVDVTRSPGNKQICVKSAPISKSGQWLACLPNQVFIRISGSRNVDTDNNTNNLDALAF